MLDVICKAEKMEFVSNFDFRMEIPHIWQSVISKIETNGIPIWNPIAYIGSTIKTINKYKEISTIRFTNPSAIGLMSSFFVVVDVRLSSSDE